MSPAPLWSEFEPDVTALQADAVLAKLRGDEDLVAFFDAGIVPLEVEQLFLEKSSLRANTLGVSIGPQVERRIGTAQLAELEQAIDLFLLTSSSDARTSTSWLRPRVVARIKSLLQEEGGVLRDPEGNLIAEALTRFERLDFQGRVRGSNLIVTGLRVVYYADLDQRLRDELA